LSRYAPHSVATEELKVSMYIAGLGPEFVSLKQLFEHTFLQVADVARQMEIDLRSHGIILDGDRKKKNKVEVQSSAQSSGSFSRTRDFSEGSSQPMGHRGPRERRQGRRSSRLSRGVRLIFGFSSSGQSSGQSSSGLGSGPCPQCGRPHRG